jgi:hypothetical protein
VQTRDLNDYDTALGIDDSTDTDSVDVDGTVA